MCFSKITNGYINCLHGREFIWLFEGKVFAWPHMTTSLPHTSPISLNGVTEQHLLQAGEGPINTAQPPPSTPSLMPGRNYWLASRVSRGASSLSPELHSLVPSRLFSHRAPVQGLRAIAHCLSISTVPRAGLSVHGARGNIV